jgi:hypothetical protein
MRTYTHTHTHTHTHPINNGWTQWHTSIIPARKRSTNKSVAVQASLDIKQHPISKIANIKRANTRETAKIPHYRRMDQENVVLIHKGILLSHKEE